MGFVLFVTELGGGYGHVKRLLPVAAAAKAAGHRVLFVVTNPEEPHQFLSQAGFDVQPGPFAAWQSRTRPTGVATSFGDILGSAGFADPELLEGVTRAWDALLETLRPDAIVCEFSPFLNLATFGTGRRVLVLGHGFILPPPDLPSFPTLWNGTPLYGERELLGNVARACALRDRAAPSTLPQLLRGSDHVVTGLDLLDPYREHRRRPAVGPPALESRLAERPPQEDVFAYLLGDAAPTLKVLRALALCGARGRVFVRRGTPTHRAAVARSGLTWLERPAPIRDALECARLIVHHGSMLTTEEGLSAGRPQVVVPLYLEHLFTARSLVALGVGTVARPSKQEQDVAAVIASALASDSLPRASRAFAERYWETSAPPGDLAASLIQKVFA